MGKDSSRAGPDRGSVLGEHDRRDRTSGRVSVLGRSFSGSSMEVTRQSMSEL